MSEKKVKKERAKGKPTPAIKWFQDQAMATPDAATIRAAAEQQKYSPSTISIQLGRLRANGQLTPSVKVTEKVEVKKVGRPRGIRPVPKPGKQATL